MKENMYYSAHILLMAHLLVLKHACNHIPEHNEADKLLIDNADNKPTSPSDQTCILLSVRENLSVDLRYQCNFTT